MQHAVQCWRRQSRLHAFMHHIDIWVSFFNRTHNGMFRTQRYTVTFRSYVRTTSQKSLVKARFLRNNSCVGRFMLKGKIRYAVLPPPRSHPCETLKASGLSWWQSLSRHTHSSGTQNDSQLCTSIRILLNSDTLTWLLSPLWQTIRSATDRSHASVQQSWTLQNILTTLYSLKSIYLRIGTRFYNASLLNSYSTRNATFAPMWSIIT